MNEYGLLCPKCNGATTVTNSRPKKNGTTKRDRKCLNCNYRFRTVEIVREKDRSDTE